MALLSSLTRPNTAAIARMRLLFLSRDFPTPFQPHNAAFNARLCKALATRHDVRVLCPVSWVEEWRNREASRKLRDNDRRINCDVPVALPRYYYVPRIFRQHHGTFLWHSIARTADRLLADFQPVAVIGYWTHPDGEVALRLARRLCVPGIVMVGGSDVLVLARQPKRRAQIARVLRSADAVIAVSEDLKRHIAELGVPDEKVHVVYRGVDIERFKPGNRVAARQKLGLSTHGRVLVWVGRMAPVKAVHVLIDACAILKSRGVEHQLCLVGSGELLSELAARVERKGLTDHVKFPGPVGHADLPDWFRAGDLTILPSLSEGVPNVLLESISCGTPFVASRVGGIPEIADERYDRLVEPGDAEALAAAIQDQLSAPAPSTPRRFTLKRWADSAQQIEGVIEGLRGHWRPPRDRRPVSRSPSVECRGRPNRFRQLLRQGMSTALPRRLFLTAGPCDSGMICLTFDDGPHPDYTPKVLDALQRDGVRATFFLIGERAAAHPELVQRIVSEGHTIGHHTYYHKNPRDLSAREFSRELQLSQQLLTEVTGSPNWLFRPPYGKLTAAKLSRLWLQGHSVVLWNNDPKDYACQSPQEIERWFHCHPVRAGDIVLLHDVSPHIVHALPELIRNVRSRGLDYATIDQWIR